MIFESFNVIIHFCFQVKDKIKKGEGGVYADVNIDILNQEIQVDSNGKTKEIQVNGSKSMANQSIPNGTPNGGFVGDETEMVSRL